MEIGKIILVAFLILFLLAFTIWFVVLAIKSYKLEKRKVELQEREVVVLENYFEYLVLEDLEDIE